MTSMIGTAFIIQRLINDFNCSGPDCGKCIFNIELEDRADCLADLLEDKLEEIDFEKELFKRCK